MHAIRVPRRANLSLLFVFLFLGLFCITACNSGGEASQSVTIRYAGDARAYGVLIRSGDTQALTTAAEADPPCSMTAAAVAAGCNGSVEASANGLRLALRGCFVEPDDALFDCKLAAGRIEQLRSNATVTAGCGCQQNCPAAPAISMCETSTESCQQAATSASAKVQAVSTTTRVTGETTCPTCCETDYIDDAYATLTSTQPLTEIEWRLGVPEDCDLSALDCNVEDPSTWKYDFVSRVDADTLRYCLLAASSVEPSIALPLMHCEKGAMAGAVVVRALDANFEPLAILPTIEME